MTRKGKRYREAASRYDRDEQYTGLSLIHIWTLPTKRIV